MVVLCQKAQRRTPVIGSPTFVGLPSFVYPYLAFLSALPCFRTILSNQQKNAIYPARRIFSLPDCKEKEMSPESVAG